MKWNVWNKGEEPDIETDPNFIVEGYSRDVLIQMSDGKHNVSYFSYGHWDFVGNYYSSDDVVAWAYIESYDPKKIKKM